MIDITFDFTSDTPSGKDADTFSPTLRTYHQLLWSKPLPGGAPFVLDCSDPPPYYLHHFSELGEFWLASDVALPHFLYLASIIDQVPEAEREELWPIGYTIGGSIVFPAARVGRRMTINGARAFHPKIRDRFDLTVECIRRHYLDEASPLSPVLARHAEFFELFCDFSGYVEFFHLQDLVNEGTSTVRFFMPFHDFAASPLPATLDAYHGYRQHAIEFIESRNRRIAAYVAKNPPTAPPPVWDSPRFEGVLAHAESVGQLGLLEGLLEAGDRLGLYLRPYPFSVMFTPPTNRTRMLFTVTPDTGGTRIWVSADAFGQFFPEISADETRRQLGPADEERLLDQTATRKFIAGLGRLLNEMPR